MPGGWRLQGMMATLLLDEVGVDKQLCDVVRNL